MNNPTYAAESGHWYTRDGLPAYEQPNKSSGGTRPTTLRDAKKLNLLPSVTTILGAASKPALTRWLQHNAIVAALTTPKMDGESMDDFADRVLSVDAASISNAAKELGTRIHAQIEQYYTDGSKGDLWSFVEPVVEACKVFGEVVSTEKTVVGDGYAGKVDIVFLKDGKLRVVDFKTCSKLPREQYEEHLMQLGAYSAALKSDGNTANVYIETTTPGKIKIVENDTLEWKDAYYLGFVPLFKFWQFRNSYTP